MTTDNTITLAGNLTRTVELRYTPNGEPVAKFGLAVNRRWQNRQSQEWEETTSFFNIVCWGTLAQNTAKSLTRGSRAVITGRIDQRSWETPEGDKRSVIEITADDIAPSLRWATTTITKTSQPNTSGPGSEPNAAHNPDEEF